MAAPRRKRPPVRRGGAIFRLALTLLLLALALVPFFATTRLDGRGGGGGGGSDEAIQPVSCQRYLNDPSIYDSNRDLTRDETLRLTTTDPQFYISLHSQWFDKMRWVHIMKQGEYYEKGLTRLFRRILTEYDTTSTPRPLMLDVGVNIGWFSLYARSIGHDFAAFEPNPTMFLRVCESLEHNGWENDGGITLWNYGLGVTPGTFNITTGNNPGGSSFHEDRLAAKFRKKMPVAVTTLDTVALQQGWLDRKISLMKVDVEGFENFVFEGGRKFVYNGNIDNIIMENSISEKKVVGGMVDLLYGAGYRVKEILSVNGDPYHEDWWHTFNPELEKRHNAKGGIESDQINFLSKATSNIWWQQKRIMDKNR